ncbi:MAG: hypothetical protein JNL49_05955 [Bacteroidia bacterium]|nr:hypothetical protein [Bacteroidia bacterium]
MPFKKGESGNPTGKPPGAKNKIGIQLRETISNFLIDNFDTIQKDFKKLNPKDRAKIYCDLLQYGLPRLQAVSNEFQFEQLTDEQLTEVIEKLKQSALNDH